MFGFTANCWCCAFTSFSKRSYVSRGKSSGGDIYVHKCISFVSERVHTVRYMCQGGQKVNHVMSSADCSLRAEALTTGPAVWLHPSDASRSLYGSRPKATAHKGWYTARFSHSFVRFFYWSLKEERLLFLLASPHGPGGQVSGSDLERRPWSWTQGRELILNTEICYGLMEKWMYHVNGSSCGKLTLVLHQFINVSTEYNSV